MKSRKYVLLVVIYFSINISACSQNESKLKSTVIGEGTAIILIPGLTSSGTVWDETVSSLGENYQYHIIDLPGFAGNESIEDHEGRYLEKMRDSIIEYAEQEKLHNPVIIGHSLGGFLALNIAMKQPDLPSKLVIVDALPFLPAMRNPSITQESAVTYATNYKATMVEKANLPIKQKKETQKEFLKWMINDPLNIETATQWYLDSDSETVIQAMYEMNTTDIRDDLKKVNAPTLVLGSWVAGKQYGATRDGALKAYRAQYANLKNVQVDMSDKGKHFIMWDDPEFFIDWLEKFL